MRKADANIAISVSKKLLDDLLDERSKTEDLLHAKGGSDLQLIQRLGYLNREIREAQDFYNIKLLESLQSESRKLNRFTTVLIALTALLSLLTAVLVIRTVG
jgi:hypothetical protein